MRKRNTLRNDPFFVNCLRPWPSGLFWLAVKKLKMDEIESWSTEILIIRLTEQDIGCIGFEVSIFLIISYDSYGIFLKVNEIVKLHCQNVSNYTISKISHQFEINLRSRYI